MFIPVFVILLFSVTVFRSLGEINFYVTEDPKRVKTCATFKWKWDFIHLQSKLVFIWMVGHQASLWWRSRLKATRKWTITELGYHKSWSIKCFRCRTIILLQMRYVTKNIPQLKLVKFRVIFPNFQNCAYGKKYLKDNKHHSLHLAPADNWSARHWQITIFCSTSSNNCCNGNLLGFTEYGNEELHSVKHYQLSYVALFFCLTLFSFYV